MVEVRGDAATAVSESLAEDRLGEVVVLEPPPNSQSPSRPSASSADSSSGLGGRAREPARRRFVGRGSDGDVVGVLSVSLLAGVVSVLLLPNSHCIWNIVERLAAVGKG